MKSAFLNGVLQEDVYVDQTGGFMKSGNEDKVINIYLLSCGFQRNPSEAILYIKLRNEESLIVSIYMDDIVYTGSCAMLIEEFNQDMMK